MSIPKIYEMPEPLQGYFRYITSIKNLSALTVEEYYLDLRTFFRFLKVSKLKYSENKEFDDIDISDITIDNIKSVRYSDLLDFLIFLGTERPKYHKSEKTSYGDEPRTRARKVAALRSYFKYLYSHEHLIDENPAADLESPKAKVDLPKFLTVDESLALLASVDGPYKERDYCILMLFLNCGLRVSELVGINFSDITDNMLRVRGKGNKVRILHLNAGTREAIDRYLPTRIEPDNIASSDALFISRHRDRMSVQTVKAMVNKYLNRAGLAYKDCSAHKLRHTAATLMYQNGVDIRTVQEFLGHENVSTTMIYTHLANSAIRDAAESNPLGKLAKLPEKADEKVNDDDNI